MSGILRLESLTKGNTLKQGDKTPLKYRLFDADGENLNIAGKSAKVRLVYPDFLTIGYEKDGLTVAQDDTVTFTIDGVIPSRIYHVEIIVDGQFIFPSRADESKFTVDKSSLGTEANIIEIVGVDAVVRKAVDLINDDPSLIIDEDKLVTDIIANTGIKNIDEYYQQYSDVIKELSENKDYHSLPEIAGARGGFDTLGERLNKTNESIGEVNADLQTTKNTLSDIVLSPAGSVSEQEIIEARKGETTLGSKVEKIDTNLENQSKSVFEHFYRFGNDYPEKRTGGWRQGPKNATTTGEISYNVDHININFTNTGGVGQLGLTTNNQINLTHIDTLYIDWELVSGGNGPRMAFGIHNAIGPAYSQFVESTVVYGLSPRRTSKIDVSKYKGDYRIHVQPYTTATSSNIDVKIYNIYADTKLATGLDLESIDNKFEKTNGYFGQQVYLNENGSIYTESANNHFYFKILTGSLLFRAGNYANMFDNNYMIGSVPEKNVTTSPNGVTDVVRLSTSQVLVLDLENASNRLTVIDRDDFDYLKHYPLIVASSGVVTGGQLHNLIQDKQINELKFGSINDNQQALDNVMYKATNENGNDVFRLLFITDTHAEGGAFESGKQFLSNVKNLEAFGLSDLVIHGGDIINGQLASKQTALQNLLRLTKILNSTTPTAILAGNHDDNSYFNTSSVTEDFKITKEEWDKFIVSQFKDDFVFNENQPLSKYFYKDFEHKKIRVICVDGVDMPDVKNTDGTYKWRGTNGWGYGVEQLNWLGNTALQLPSDDWHIILVGHMEHEREGALPYNSDVLDNIIKAFKERTTYATTVTGIMEWNGVIDVDLTTTNGVIVGYFHGHNHADKMVVNSISGITHVSTTRAQRDRNGAFDVINVNKNERTVRLTRYADGVDREFTY